MFEADDFYLDDDELGEENQMSMVDEAIYKSLEGMQKSITELMNNLKFNEVQDQKNSLRLIAMHLDSAITLANIDENNLTEEEVFEEIEKVLKQTTELTFSNIDRVIPKIEEDDDDNTTALNPGDLGDSTDW